MQPGLAMHQVLEAGPLTLLVRRISPTVISAGTIASMLINKVVSLMRAFHTPSPISSPAY
jgi:hypothetical protein